MEQVMTVVLIAVLVTAIYTDLRASRIPNWLTFAAIGFGLAVHTYSAGFQGALFSLAGLGLVLGPFFVLYVLGSIGAGDVKLMGAVGAIVGPYGAVSAAVLSVIVGGLYALGAMSYQWGIAGTGRKLVSATYSVLISKGSVWAGDLQLPFRLRYGLSIAGGTLLFVLGLHPFEVWAR